MEMEMANMESSETSRKLAGNKYLPKFKPLYINNESGTGSGYVGLSEPTHGTSEKAKVWATTKPNFCSKTEIPGLWPSSFSDKHCCFYRVPNRLRRVNPEAYTPQMLLIGPLHHSKKADALERYKTDSRYIHTHYIMHTKGLFLIVFVFMFTFIFIC